MSIKTFFQAIMILVFLIWTFLPAIVKATTPSGLGLSLDGNSSYSTTLNTDVSNAGTTPAGDISVELGTYHCKTAGTAACAPDLTPGDLADDSPRSASTRTLNIPAPGTNKLGTLSNLPVFSCGRVQVDVGLSNNGGILGGKTFSLGSDCPAPQTCDFTFKYPECDSKGAGWVHEVWQDCHGNYQVRNVQYQGGGVCGSSLPQPTATPQPQTEMASTCKGVKTRAQMQAELRGAGYPGPWNLNDEIAAYDRAACPLVTTTPTPTANPTVAPTVTPIVVPPPAGGPTVSNQVSCPAGYVQALSGSTIVCVKQVQEQTQTQTAQGGYAYSYANASTAPVTVNLAGQPTPQVVYYYQQPQVMKVAYDVTTLPKTGLPLVAWGLSGLLPVGLGFRKFGSHGKDLTNLGKYLWEKREFLKE